MGKPNNQSQICRHRTSARGSLINTACVKANVLTFLTVIASILFAAPPFANAQTIGWQTRNNEAVIRYGSRAESVILGVGYTHLPCNSALARVVLIRGTDLGTILKHKWSTGLFADMIWEVNGRAYHSKTLIVDHANGSEYVMMASPSLLAALDTGKTINLALPKNPAIVIKNPPGFGRAFDGARRNFCFR